MKNCLFLIQISFFLQLMTPNAFGVNMREADRIETDLPKNVCYIGTYIDKDFSRLYGNCSSVLISPQYQNHFINFLTAKHCVQEKSVGALMPFIEITCPSSKKVRASVFDGDFKITPHPQEWRDTAIFQVRAESLLQIEGLKLPSGDEKQNQLLDRNNCSFFGYSESSELKGIKVSIINDSNYENYHNLRLRHFHFLFIWNFFERQKSHFFQRVADLSDLTTEELSNSGYSIEDFEKLLDVAGLEYREVLSFHPKYLALSIRDLNNTFNTPLDEIRKRAEFYTFNINTVGLQIYKENLENTRYKPFILVRGRSGHYSPSSVHGNSGGALICKSHDNQDFLTGIASMKGITFKAGINGDIFAGVFESVL